MLLLLLACAEQRACHDYVDARNECWSKLYPEDELKTYEESCSSGLSRRNYECLRDAYTGKHCYAPEGLDLALDEAQLCREDYLE